MGGHPRERVRTLVVTTPSNTAIAAAISTNWTPGPGVLERLELVIPDGHAGLTGLQLLWGGRQVVPYEATDFLQGNNDEISVDLGLDVSGKTLVVRTYNLDDTFGHSHYLRGYLVDRQPSVDQLFAGAPSIVDASSFVTSPEAPDLGPFTEGEWLQVSTALDSFLAQLQQILDGFLVELDAALGGTSTAADTGTASTESTPTEPTATTKTGNAVPNVIGDTRDVARQKLRAAGFTVNITTKRERGKEVVIAQQPDAGRIRDPGFAVGITVRVNP